MEIDTIVESLNSQNNISNIAAGIFENPYLTELEKTLIEIYVPQNVLIVYGTLAPDAPNHKVVEHIKGNWEQGIVKGCLLKEGWGADMGYWGFQHVPVEQQEEIPVFVLFSDELPPNWAYLDNFEGEEYKRILAKYELKNGQTGVGNIYAVNEAAI